jgi:hypothetical protein
MTRRRAPDRETGTEGNIPSKESSCGDGKLYLAICLVRHLVFGFTRQERGQEQPQDNHKTGQDKTAREPKTRQDKMRGQSQGKRQDNTKTRQDKDKTRLKQIGNLAAPELFSMPPNESPKWH